MPSDRDSEAKVLIEGCASGDPASRSAFVERYDRLIRSAVASMIRRYGAGGHDHEDMVNHVYEKLLERDCHRLSAWRGTARFTTYLVQVTRNLAIDYGRTVARSRRALASAQLAEDMGRETDTARDDDLDESLLHALRAELANLSQQQALIIRMRMQGLTLRRIAALLDLPHGTVFSESARAMKKLRETLLETRRRLAGDELESTS